MKFRDILKKDRTKNEIFLGERSFGGDYTVDLDTHPSIIITGETGTGKSILLDQILCQIIAKHTSLEMGLVLVDTGGIELNYYSRSKYSLFSAINNKNDSVTAIAKILREIERRKQLLIEQGVTTFVEYNMIAEKKLPKIFLAIDDDKSMLSLPDMEKQLSSIIASVNGLGIYILLATNDVYNKFFERDNNTLSSLRISFDLSSYEESVRTNIAGAESLGIGNIIITDGNENSVCNTYSFDDHIITEIIER